MYAIVETGGKQYRVKPGDTVAVERLTGEPGETLDLERVLLVGDNGESPRIGTPGVDGTEVPVLHADALFRAVAVPAGEHDVDVFFDSSAFTRGALISLAGLIVIILVFAGPYLPRMGVRVHSR